MRRLHVALSACFIACVVLTGCAGRELVPGKAKGMAWVDVSGRTPEQVAAAAKKVFIEDGYELIEHNGTQLVFEKPGSRMKDIAYGGLANEEGVWIKAVLNINPKDNNTCWVSCDAYIIKDRDDDFFRDDQKVLKLFGREYQLLLDRVKREALRQADPLP
jgi:hypothetical protein